MRSLLVAAAILLVVGGCEAVQDSPAPLAPEPSTAARAVDDDGPGLPGYKVTMRTPDGAWRPTRDIEPGLVLKTTPGTWFLRLHYASDTSPLFGYSWPDIPTCYEPPGTYPAEGTWRVTDSDTPGLTWPNPEVNRQEMNVRGWNVAGLNDTRREFWFRAEHWDITTGQYREPSPWFKVVLVTQAELDDREFEEGQ